MAATTNVEALGNTYLALRSLLAVVGEIAAKLGFARFRDIEPFDCQVGIAGIKLAGYYCCSS